MDIDFVLSLNNKIYSGSNTAEKFLLSKNLLKSYSLLIASESGIKIPPTFLIVSDTPEFNQSFLKNWKLPIVVRVDYEKYPDSKFLGGIPLYSYSTCNKISTYILHNNCYPIFHPNIDRFQDVYSLGILLSPGSDEIIVEILGKGFDASDLRLGQFSPHEVISINIKDFKINFRKLITQNEYIDQRKLRSKKISKLHSYIKMVNKSFKLSVNIDQYIGITISKEEIDCIIPNIYNPLPDNLIQSIMEIAMIINLKVLPRLPSSKYFIASFSSVPNYGLILWDIYGSWYIR